MKVVNLSTSDMGGAGIAAKNLHMALLEHGLNSSFVTKYKLGPELKNHFLLEEEKAGIFDRVANGIKSRIRATTGWFNDDLGNYYLKDRPKGFEHFSFPWSELEPQNNNHIAEADVVHLHWVSDGFMDYKKLFALKDKKFVWTLHDMNPFTGGCHHSDGCMKFQTNCNYCFQLKGTRDEYLSGKILNYKFEALKDINDNQLKIVAPSKWLADLSKTSHLFSRFEHQVIPNVIDINSPSKELTEALRSSHSENTVFLFVAHHFDNPRKGINTLIQALQRLKHQNFHLITVGERLSDFANDKRVIQCGYVNDKDYLKELYTKADAFILPSLAENFPNTIVEALLCGTPVIASNTGGIPEQVNDNNGVLVEPNDVEAWKNALDNFIENKNRFNRRHIQEQAEQTYDKRKIVSEYLHVYQSLIRS
jgi:glycosyltransferase involved in cell wall biosynthesis